jgi:hypothetical protein
MLEEIPPAGAALDPSHRDTQTQALAFVGREDRFVTAENTKVSCQPLAQDGVEVDPLAEIVRRARDAQIVIVNEAHDAPQDRAFIGDVAEALRPLGFAIYAAETFARGIGRDGPRYPRTADGVYSNEPAFGDLVRRTRTLGYAFVPYETEELSPGGDPAASIDAREEAEATNLVARVFAKDPHARVLVHVGYGHALEVPGSNGQFRSMTLRLKEKTGIDPLTISETSYGPRDERRHVCGATANGSALSPGFDLYVTPPTLRFIRGRPTWRIARGAREVEVPHALRRPNHRVIFEARRADEPNDAVPVDRVLVDPGEDVPLRAFA